MDRSYFHPRVLRRETAKMMDVNMYAEKVVTRILGQRVDPWIYEGGLAGVVWFMARFLPIGILVSRVDLVKYKCCLR
jgi:hypothetical protein